MAFALLMSGAVLTEIIREVRLSARSLVRTPVWTTTLILTIAIGIASNASVDGFVRGVVAQVSLAGDPEAADSILRIGQLLRAAAIAVFAIACANVASFLLARAAVRTRETAVRVAIGAGRQQLVRQVLADSLVISIAGAAAGAILAFWIARAVPAFLFDEDAQRMIFAADPGGVALVTVVCAAITIVCGLLPVIETRDDPGAIIQREGSGPSRGSTRLGAGLVVVQMTACTLLVVSTGLLFAGFRSALQTSAGRRLADPIVVSMEALQTSSKTVETTSGLRYFDDAVRATREIASATSVAWAATVPGNRPIWQSFELETAELPLRAMSFVATPFTTRTLDTLIMPPAAGRLFRTLDAGPCGGVVITTEAARDIGVVPIIGRSIETPAGDWADIVGVVDVREESVPRVFHYATGGEEPLPSAMATYRVPQLTPSRATVLDVNIVSANYFDFMGFPVVDGRTFTETADPCRVAMINQQAADLYFNGDAVGAAIIDRLGRRSRIIGVVGSAKLRAAARAMPPTVYFPMEQDFLFRMTLVAETAGIDTATLDRLHRRLALIPGGREDRIIVRTLDDHLSRTALAPERIATVLVGSSATIALALGMLGLYGLMSEASRRRQREFALRIALGARGGHVFRQVIAEGGRLVIAGVFAGMLGSVPVAQLISRITPANEPPSPWIWIAAPLTLALAVTIASVLPARTALASDPLSIMKADQ
jgi:FtsX-like permease family/MacB-like periplasmic core domain